MVDSADMLKSQVIEHFGSGVAVARALGIGKQAVSAWGELVPPLRAAQLAQITKNKLRFDLEDYQDWNQTSTETTAA
jgi:hypothetical protein